MLKLGLIGGAGPESSIEYYRLIIKLFQEKLKTKEYPEIIVNSINMTEMLGYVFNSRYDELVEFLVERISVLEKAGADFGAIASNTPHIVFEKLAAKVDLPLISIVEETCKAIAGLNMNRLALFGTKSTMTAGFYNKVAQKNNIEIVIPVAADQDYIHDKYMNELVLNKILPETKYQLISIANKLKLENNVEGLILGGTELPLILNQNDFNDLKIFNTTVIHVESIVEKMTESK